MDLDPKSKKLEEQLEQRVRKLEDQVTILKNQIQNSLLEIQEVLATRFYHPALRPTDDGEDEDVSPPPSRRGGHQAAPSPQPSRQASMPEAPRQGAERQPDPTAAPPPVPPKVKKVSLDDIRRSRQESAAASAGNARDSGFDLVAFAEMVNWVNTSTARVGNAYTREVIDDCLTDGSLAPEIAEQLRQLIGDDLPGETREDVEPDEVIAVSTELRTILNRSARL